MPTSTPFYVCIPVVGSDSPKIGRTILCGLASTQPSVVTVVPRASLRVQHCLLLNELTHAEQALAAARASSP